MLIYPLDHQSCFLLHFLIMPWSNGNGSRYFHWMAQCVLLVRNVISTVSIAFEIFRLQHLWVVAPINRNNCFVLGVEKLFSLFPCTLSWLIRSNVSWYLQLLLFTMIYRWLITAGIQQVVVSCMHHHYTEFITFVNIQIFQNFHFCFWFSKLFFLLQLLFIYFCWKLN